MHFDVGEQPLQADLLWAVSSPDLIQLSSLPDAGTLQSITDAPFTHTLGHWITNQDHQASLGKLMASRQPRRLGIYYETLWHYVLENHPSVELITHNLPIMDGKRTAGELDFIYYCQQRQRFVHLETAVKFYLGTSAPALPDNTAQPDLCWSQWLGPGRRDRLDLKLLNMLNRQTRISLTESGKRTLAALDIEQPLREICLKGYFFYPLNTSCQPPAHQHPQHNCGYWLKFDRLDLLLDYADNWQVLTKQQWLSPALNHGQQPLFKLQQLKQHLATQLAANPFPIMIANMQAAADHYQEINRFFITPNDWSAS